MTAVKITRRWTLSLFMLVCSLAFAGENQAANVSGKWQLSWEARIGTERCIVQIDQADSKLVGTYQGRLGSPKISGNVKGKNISLKLDFQGAHPFALVLTGTVDGDRMSGKFEIEGVEGGYDGHGENVRPSNYSWTATHRTDQTQSDLSQQNQRRYHEQSRP